MIGKLNRTVHEITLVCPTCMASGTFGVDASNILDIHCINPNCETNQTSKVGIEREIELTKNASFKKAEIEKVINGEPGL